MRCGRLGGRIGASAFPGSGIWTLGDAYLGYAGLISPSGTPNWPVNTLDVGWWPENWVDATGSGSATFSPQVTATYPTLTYSWEISTDGGANWSSVPGASGPSLSVSGKTLANDGELYRIVLNAGLKTLRSSAATLRYDTVNVYFNYQPSNQTTTGTAAFDCNAGVIGVTYGWFYTPSYQWQRSTDGGSNWANLSGETNSYLSFSTTSGMNGYQYRCVASFDGTSATSNIATLTYA